MGGLYGVTGELIHLDVYKDLIWPDRRSPIGASIFVCDPQGMRAEFSKSGKLSFPAVSLAAPSV